ncbi:MAG TPA: 6-bladed beta-propeller [Longimicrobiales bacterium]|nr:6-bladed beta-propeller [Longimicrobiales bacterium]
MPVPTPTRIALAAAALLTFTTHASAQVVRSTGPGAWGATLRLVEDQRIGLLEGDEAYTFSYINNVVALDDGSIVVGESRPARLRLYGPNGRFVRNIGRIGDGPGEYRQIDGLKRTADGGVALWDGRVGRISLYDAKGEFRTSHRFVSTFFSADIFAADRSGNFYVRAPAQRMTPGTFSLDLPMMWVKVDAAGAVVDSIPVPQRPAAAVQRYGGWGNTRVDPFIAVLSPLGYFVTGDPMEYAFELMPLPSRPRTGSALADRPAPTRTLRVERQHTPVSLTRGERAEWNAWAEYLSQQPIGMSMRVVNGRPDTLRGPTVRYIVPSTKPAFKALSVDAEGVIWVERYVEAQQTTQPAPPPGQPRPPSNWREPRTFDLFEPTGRFLGTIVAPPRVTLRARRGMQVYGVLSGEFDEQYMVRYRITPAAR